jgi:hypothetical protein
MPPPRTHRAWPTWCAIVTEWPPSGGAAVWRGRSRQAAMIRVAIDSGEGKKCAPPAPFFRQPAAPIDPDFQQGCSQSDAIKKRPLLDVTCDTRHSRQPVLPGCLESWPVLGDASRMLQSSCTGSSTPQHCLKRPHDRRRQCLPVGRGLRG